MATAEDANASKAAWIGLMKMDYRQFQIIRNAYSREMPKVVSEYLKTGNMAQDPYILDWASVFTPIEAFVWCDIRGNDLPFFPQFPILKYFADFACPYLKIVIECDGKNWHSKEKDAERDARMAEYGWMVFRISGHECVSIIDSPWELEEDDPNIKRWFNKTASGLIYAIRHKYFLGMQTRFSKRNWDFIEETIHLHRTTSSSLITMNCWRAA